MSEGASYGVDPNVRSELEELVASSEIEFPRPLAIDGVRDMFSYIARNSPYAATIRVEQLEHYRTSEGKIGHVDVTKITGIIEEKEHIIMFSSFTLEREIDDDTETSIFTRLNFQTSPGYSLAEHRKDEIAVWDGTREAIRDYFRVNPWLSFSKPQLTKFNNKLLMV